MMTGLEEAQKLLDVLNQKMPGVEEIELKDDESSDGGLFGDDDDDW